MLTREHKLTTLAPQLRNQVEAIVNNAFVHGLHAVMLLSIIVCALSVSAALWGRDKAKKGALHLPHLAHPLWPHLWKRVPVSQ